MTSAFDDSAAGRPPAQGTPCCNAAWEAAYERFETAEEEVTKFVRRLVALGAARWSRDAEVVDLFCGRGGGLRALTRLGFTRIEGVDLSSSLLAQYAGPALCHIADCRELPFPSASRDVLMVQGGLHHLVSLPSDLDRVLAEAMRVLREGGRLVVVEPWMTPFLRSAHLLCRSSLARRLSSKVDALAVMIDEERATYEQWLRQPALILARLSARFEIERQSIAWGKLNWVGVKRRLPGSGDAEPLV